jgi:tRNA-splicing ligase RtcB
MTDKYVVFDEGPKPIKAWVQGVHFDERAKEQVMNLSHLPFVFKHIAVMPDAHWGMGSTVGSVIPTQKAIIPAAVGVDIGCGMMACQTTLNGNDLPDNLKPVRQAIEKAVPVGRGKWKEIPSRVAVQWKTIEEDFKNICEKHPEISKTNNVNHLGTLGTGNHFIEVCLDEMDQVWLMLHSGSRGVGNRIGTYFIGLAKQDMERWFIHLPDHNLAYFPEGSENFSKYMEAVGWAQKFAFLNREIMMRNIVEALQQCRGLPPFDLSEMAVNCHHNYVEMEHHFKKNIWVTRKGAVRAREGDLGIIPGSMGAKSFIVRGKGNPDSFCSCSHGAGRMMSRTRAEELFTVEDHIKATEGVECRKDAGVIDETPMAYKDIDAVMEAQSDLVEVVHTLKQVVCVKG